MFKVTIGALLRTIAALGLFVSCLSAVPANAVSQAYEAAGTWPAVTWHLTKPHGVATDAVGNAYVADTGNNRVVKYDVYGRYVTSWGGKGTDDGKFDQPWDVACDPSGTRVFVADTYNHRVQQFSVQGKSSKFVRRWGTRGGQDFTGSNTGEFESPKGIALDSAGNVYVLDTGNERIQKFSITSAGVKNNGWWGTAGSGESMFYEPYAIDISNSGRVYVLDRNKTNCYVRVFDLDGKPFRFANSSNGWGAYTYTASQGLFSAPEGIAVDDEGNVYVADSTFLSMWIQKFTPDGQWVTGWGTWAEGDTSEGQPAFKSLGGLDASGSGPNVRLIAADYTNDRLREFSGDGIPLTKRDSLGVLGSHGAAWWRFKEPWGVAVGPSGSVYVADRLNHRLERYNSNGVLDIVTPQMIPPPKRVDNGFFVEPSAVAYDPVSEYVYVAESGDETNYKDNNRIQRFNADLAYLNKWGELGTGAGQFKHPQGVAVGPGYGGGRSVFVSDTGNNRIQVFDLLGNFQKYIGEEIGVLSAPAGIAVSENGEVFVVNSGQKKVTRFVPNSAKTDWTTGSSFGSSGTGDAVLSQPWGLALDDNGYVYVTDVGAHKMKKYQASSGAFDTAIGMSGTSPGQLNMPRGVAVSKSGIVYVADTVNDRFQAFVKPIVISITYPADLTSYSGPVMPAYTLGEGWIDQGQDLDGATWDEQIVKTEGVHVFRVWAKDVNGLTHEKVVQFTIDLTPPTTLANDSPSYSNSAIISLSALDSMSGVAKTYWRLDGGLAQEGGIVATSKAGAHTLEYWSQDLAGNVESPHNVTQFSITDTTAPVTTSNAVSSYADKATITLTAKDTGSTVASTMYQLDGGPIVTGKVMTTTAVGNHVLKFRSVDSVNNFESWRSASFNLRKGTALVASRGTSPVSYGGTGTTKATLKLSNGTLLKNKPVKLYRSKDGVNWAYVKTVTSSTGYYAYSTPLYRLTHFKWDFSGDATYRATSGKTYVDAKAKLGKPAGATITAKYRNTYYYGDLRPHHTAGTEALTIRAYRYESGKYVYKKSTKIRIQDKETYSKYFGAVNFPSAGKWRIRAYHNDADHAASYSSYFYLTVN